MKRSKVICLMMSLVLVFMSVTMAYSVDVDNYDEIVIQSEYDNEMNKLHFYFSTNDDGKWKRSNIIISKYNYKL